jgi:hypothetical protein
MIAHRSKEMAKMTTTIGKNYLRNVREEKNDLFPAENDAFSAIKEVLAINHFFVFYSLSKH